MKKLDPVDDYMGAIGPRARSVRILIRNNRRTIAQHLGGMTVECIIKSAVVHASGITHWACTAYPASPPNPRHELQRAVSLLPTAIQTMLLSSTSFITAIEAIQRPPGLKRNYPELRYTVTEPPDVDFQVWRDAYREVVNRLHDTFKRHIHSSRGSWSR
ncbi:hypothetical protein WMF38_34890 [Sorangium sp. So ce118]